MKKITNAGWMGLLFTLCLAGSFATQAVEQEGGEFDLDAMELAEPEGDTSIEDAFVLEDEISDGGEDFYLDDVDADVSGDVTEEDTLVLEEDVLDLDDVTEEVASTTQGSEPVVEGDDVLPEGAGATLAETDEELGIAPEAPGEEVVSMDSMDADLADIEAITELESESDVMVLDGGEEMAPGVTDEMADLDAEMADMMAGPGDGDAADLEAIAIDEEEFMMLGGDEELVPGSEGELEGMDADMAAMMGDSDEVEGDDEGGALMLDEMGVAETVTGEDEGAEGESGGALVMGDAGDDDEAEYEESSLSVYAVLKNETAVFVSSGTVIGGEKSTLGGGSHDAGKLYKSEFSLNIFANAQITPDSVVHAQLNLAYDPKADPSWYRKPQAYTQYEFLRELYLDTTLPLFDEEGITMRAGKQQVVWGTADGIKLLDIINPTDYREFVQNTFEDSRIPVWMLNLERNIGENSNFQLIAAQNRRNRIPGLDQDGDSGQPFIMKGVDSITGSVNGFLNIAPAMGKVADAFTRFAALSGSPVGLTPLSFVTVDDFATNNPVAQSIFGSACSPTFNPAAPTSAACLKNITERPDQAAPTGAVLPGGDNQFVTNLIDSTTQSEWDTDNPNSAFEYMGNATFATFNTFASAKSRYEREDPDEMSPNLGGRWKSSLGSNFNYSLNYFYSYDSNPSVSMSWENASGEKLSVKKVRAQQYVDAGILAGVPAGTENLQTIILKDSAGRSYGPFDGDPTSAGFGGPGAGAPTLVFTEERNRIHNIGASFDYAMDTGALGSFVLRGEFLYQRDVRVPMVDRSELSIGNITQGLYPDEVDYFKYVLGAETILLTNLTVSAQFIQFVNLNFEGGSDAYHASQAVVHLSNNLKKGYKYTNFGSLFLSKPFGAQQDGRVNNIIIAERGGGYWNRLDVEYRFTDSLIGSAEWNMYFGDEDTMFGQFKDSSNFQLGIKYIFE